MVLGFENTEIQIPANSLNLLTQLHDRDTDGCFQACLFFQVFISVRNASQFHENFSKNAMLPKYAGSVFQTECAILLIRGNSTVRLSEHLSCSVCRKGQNGSDKKRGD